MSQKRFLTPLAPTYYSRTRDYPPTLGRFTEQNPLGFDSGDVNLYRFVHDNPTNATDPLGAQEVSAAMAMAMLSAQFAVEKAINDLDSDRFLTRQAASDRLHSWLRSPLVGQIVSQRLKQLLADPNATLEQQRRAGRLLADLDTDRRTELTERVRKSLDLDRLINDLDSNDAKTRFCARDSLCAILEKEKDPEVKKVVIEILRKVVLDTTEPFARRFWAQYCLKKIGVDVELVIPPPIRPPPAPAAPPAPPPIPFV